MKSFSNWKKRKIIELDANIKNKTEENIQLETQIENLNIDILKKFKDSAEIKKAIDKKYIELAKIIRENRRLNDVLIRKKDALDHINKKLKTYKNDEISLNVQLEDETFKDFPLNTNYKVSTNEIIIDKETGEKLNIIVNNNKKYVTLKHNDQNMLIGIHKIIYITFIKLMSMNTIVSHIDGNSMNNSVNNLYCKYLSYFDTPKIVKYDENFTFIDEYSCIATVKEQFSPDKIEIACDKLTMYEGFYWRYKLYDFVPLKQIDNINIEDGYFIDIYGTIINKKYNSSLKYLTRGGFYYVKLNTTIGEVIIRRVDLLVWSTFKEPTNKVYHINKNVKDNRLENLAEDK